MQRSSAPHLVLASSSPYRRELLGRLGIPFSCHAPAIDEAALPGEAPPDTALRLALAKAARVAQVYPAALILGSDQVASLNGLPVGKPGDREAARGQLQAASGREICFHTAVCLLDATSGVSRSTVVPGSVRYRTLSPEVIERYLTADEPYDCAGSTRIESLGISLVEWVRCEDPTALIGLPLIAVTGMLQGAGLDLP